MNTLGSNFSEGAVRKAALPSFSTMEKPPTRGEYSMSTMKVLSSTMGMAKILQDVYRNLTRK